MRNHALDTAAARRRSRAALPLLPLLLAVALAGAAARAAVDPGFEEVRLATGLDHPTAIAVARDGRIFVAEQTGALRVISGDRLLARPFASFNVDARGERGLLGVALHPDFPRTPYVYVYYTATRPTVHNRVSRLTAKGNRIKPRSEVRLLDLPPLGPTNHNGGGLHFGPDGKLYVAVGENANGANAQSLATPLGKILRLEADGRIPNDNPFYGDTTGIARASWALGLRNPFTFAFSRSGRLFLNDVGQSTWEEIDDGAAGANYGWPQTEGPTSDPRFVAPLYSYRHDGGACAIAGGAFYDLPGGAGAPPGLYPLPYRDHYYFADFCAGWIRRIPVDGGAVSGFATDIANPTDLAVDDAGNLYYVAWGSGDVVRVRFVG